MYKEAIKIKPFIKYSIIFTIGLTLGIVATALWSGNMISRSLILLKTIELHSSGELAFDAYQNQEASTGIWALSNHLTKIDTLRDEGYPEEHELQFHSIVTHARLAKMYGSKEVEEKQDYHVEKALSIARSTDRKAFEHLVSPESLWPFIEDLDSRKLP